MTTAAPAAPARPAPTSRPEWAELEAHAKRLAGTHLRELFKADANRGPSLAFEGPGGMLMDISKQRIDAQALASLIALARACGVEQRRDHVPVEVRPRGLTVHEEHRGHGVTRTLVDRGDPDLAAVDRVLDDGVRRLVRPVLQSFEAVVRCAQQVHVLNVAPRARSGDRSCAATR